MQISTKKFAAYLIITIILSLGLSISLQSLLADWAAPTAGPPGDNVSAPLYATSSGEQYIHKDESGNGGSLGVEGNFSVMGESYFAGNVGIGTSNPSQKLDVDLGNILVQGTGSYDAIGERAYLYLGDTQAYISSDYGSGLKLGVWQAPDALMIEQTTGNVGIGKNDPSYKLDVNGDIYASGDVCIPGGICLSSGGGGGGGELSYTTTEYSDSCTTCNRDTNLGFHDFCASGGYAGPGGTNTNCHVYQDASDAWILHIEDGDTPGETQRCSALCFDSTGAGAGDDLGNHTATENIKLNGNWISGNAEGDDTDEGIYIDADGNVGIGQTPGYKLDVNGSVNGSTLCISGVCRNSWQTCKKYDTGEAADTGVIDIDLISDFGVNICKGEGCFYRVISYNSVGALRKFYLSSDVGYYQADDNHWIDAKTDEHGINGDATKTVFLQWDEDMDSIVDFQLYDDAPLGGQMSPDKWRIKDLDVDRGFIFIVCD